MGKKLLHILFFIQLTTLAIFAVSVFNMTNVLNILYNGNARISLASADAEGINLHERDFLLNHLYDKGIHISRHIYSDHYNVTIYTTDTAISNRLPTNGRMQTNLTPNFVISAIGSLLFDFYERLNVTVSNINESSLAAEGVYSISLTDPIEINNLVETLNHNSLPVVLIQINNRSIVEIFLLMSFAFFTQFTALHVFMLLCTFIILIQYAIGQLKSGAVLLMHGHSSISLAKSIALNTTKLFFVPYLVASILFFAYGLFIIGYSAIFMLLLLLYFSVACLALLCVYITFIYAITHICLRNISANNILKGRKPYFFIHISNNILRIFVFIFLFTTLGTVLADIEASRNRVSMQPTWGRAQHIHRMRISFIGGQPDRLDIEFYGLKDLVSLHEYLSENHNSFIMNSQGHFHREFFNRAYEYDDLLDSLFLYVRVSPNYFYFNPIFSVDGTPVEDRLIIDDNVLNILVPVAFKPYHDFIIAEYLYLFYFNKVRVDNIYNSELGLNLNRTPKEDLSVNIIYVKNNQTYFTFNTRMRYEENINLTDPLVIVHTGSEHASFLLASFGTSYFLYSREYNLYNELSLALERHNRLSIPIFESVYEENANVVLMFKGEVVRNIAFIILLALMGFVITYILSVSHIEKNKYEIYVKSLFGHGFCKRNEKFLTSFFIYSFVIATASVAIMGAAILLLLLCFFTIDLLIYAFIEQMAVSKTFSTVIKGEH